MIERLSGEYVRGYTAGMLKMAEEITSNLGKISRGKRMTIKRMPLLMRCIIDSRAALRDGGGEYFIRFNSQKEDFELWRNYARNKEQVDMFLMCDGLKEAPNE